MSTHPQLEQLSAFLDGELEAAEAGALDKHLSACEQCAETLAALRATLADLRLLAEAEPSEQDSWALRSAIARARREQRVGGPRWSRVMAASSASAAVLALIVGSVMLLGNSGDPDGPGGGSRALQAEGADVEDLGVTVEEADVAYDQGSASALLSHSGPQAPAAAGGTSRDGTEGDMALSSTPDGDDAAAHRERIAACERALFGEAPDVERVPQRYIAARFNEVPAYLMLYHVPFQQRYELWVIARADCDNVLLFEQRSA